MERYQWQTEVLGSTIRVVENFDGEFGDDLVVVGDVHDPKCVAKARLIALAPELAEALRECADAINASIPEDFSHLSNAADKARALLAKLDAQ